METFVKGTEANDGGYELVVRLSADEFDAISFTDAAGMIDWLGEALEGLAMARTGQDATANDWARVILAIEGELGPRLAAIVRHAVRAHEAADGSLGQIKTMLRYPQKSTAQSLRRRAADTSRPFTQWTETHPSQRPTETIYLKPTEIYPDGSTDLDRR